MAPCAQSRLILCGLGCLLPFAAVLARLTRLQVVEHERLRSLARVEFDRESIEISPRGRILDRSGRVLAQSLPSGSCFLDPSSMKDLAASSSKLAGALGLPLEEVLRKARFPGRFVWVKRKLALEELEAVRRLRLEGVGIVPDERRGYPNGDLARGLLGLVGGDGQGLSGLELAFERSLAGKARKIHLLRDGAGRSILLAAGPEQPPPPDLFLTLDRNIQHYAEAALAEGVRRHGPQKAVLLVQEPRTGELLAVADYPPDPLKIRSLQETYEPGSTYKIVTLAGVLEERLAFIEDSLDGENGRWEVSPKVFIKDHEPIGRMSISEAMERSSNIGMAKLGLRLGADRLHRYGRMFGFGSRTGLPLPGESAGLLPSRRKTSRVVLANQSFGQGLAATPIQLVGAYSAVANGGFLMEPRLVHSLGTRTFPPAATVRRVLSSETVRTLAHVLERVVAGGTGMNAAVPGYRAAGKTGTAQKFDPATGKYSSTQYLASFVGFIPSKEPAFTILVMVALDNPKRQYYGSDVAAPIFARLARELLALRGIPPEGALAPPSLHAALGAAPTAGTSARALLKPR